MPMDDVVLLLANAAEQSQANAMISALGIGWSVTTSPTAPCALLLFVKVPWDETNIRHQLSLDLVTADGQPAKRRGEPLRVGIEFETGRPAGLVPGQSVDWAQAVNLPSLELTPGRYEWRLSVDGQPSTTRDFTVRG